MTVYVIQINDYDEYDVEVAASLMGAVNHIKSKRSNCVWRELEQTSEREWGLCAEWPEARRVEYWKITEMDVL